MIEKEKCNNCDICKKPLRKVKIKARLGNTKMIIHKSCARAVTWVMKRVIEDLEQNW